MSPANLGRATAAALVLVPAAPAILRKSGDADQK
jgi:hypothetical protein